MKGNDDELIRSFMLPGKREIADNGFSKRVIRRLPHRRAKRLSNLLNAVCIFLCCILFFVFNGFDILIRAIVKVIATQSDQLATSGINYQTLAIAAVVIAIFGIQRAFSFEE